MSFSMFPTAPAASSARKPYLEFKAGKCSMNLQAGRSDTYDVAPELTKGWIKLLKGSDGCTHFQWCDRVSGSVIDDFLVFPNDVRYYKVDTGRAQDRVYMLQWQSGSNRRFCFWMQDKSADADEENCRKLNEYIQNPPEPEAAGSGGQAPDLLRALGRPSAAAGGPARNAPSTSIGGFDFSQLLSGAATMSQPPAGGSSTATNSGTPSAALTAQDFQNAMMGVNAGAAQREPPTDLSEVLRPDQVVATGILNDPDVVADLAPHLPEGQQTGEHVEQAVRSAQFQQSVGELGAAIAQDPSGAVISNLGLPGPAGGVDARDPVNSFLDSVQAGAPRDESTASASSGDDRMRTPNTHNDEHKEDPGDDSTKMDESA